MSNQNPIQKLLATPMTRKEFIKHIGLMLLAAFGVMKFLEHLISTDSITTKKVSNTTRWGGGKFGV